jgi:hypothetical protein
MEKAYLRAVEQLGGPYSAKPKAILEQLAAEFPDLTLLVRRCAVLLLPLLLATLLLPLPLLLHRTTLTHPQVTHPILMQHVSSHLTHHRVREGRRHAQVGGGAVPPPATKWTGRQGLYMLACVCVCVCV